MLQVSCAAVSIFSQSEATRRINEALYGFAGISMRRAPERALLNSEWVKIASLYNTVYPASAYLVVRKAY
jgi:hypothetical protein